MEPYMRECYWTVMEFIDFELFDKVFAILDQFECDMVWISWGEGLRTIEGGYKAMHCYVRAPSVDAFNAFAQELENDVPLADCQPISVWPFFDEDGSLRKTPNTALVDLMANINQLAEYNQAVLHQTTLWASALWVAEPLKFDALEPLLQILAQYDAHLFYKMPFRPYEGSPIWMFDLFLKVNQVGLFEAFSKQLDSVFKTRYWHWVYKNSSIELDLEKLSPVTLETVDIFKAMLEGLD